MAEKEIALKVTTDLSQTNKQFKNAQQELEETRKALVDLALAGKQGTQEFAALEKRAGTIQDAIGDVNRRVNTLANDTPKLQLLTEAATGIAGGFAIAQGAAALFGNENEDLQKAILKTQGAMTLLNGVQSVANVLNKDAALGDKAAALAKGLYTKAIAGSNIALKAFRLALIATGIGAAVVAVGALVANWDKLTGAVMKFVNSSPVLTKILDFVTSKFQQLGEALGFLPDATEKSITTQIELFEKQKRLMEAQGKDTTEIERVILAQRLELAKKTNKDIEKAQEDLFLFEQATLFKRGEAAKAAAEKRAEIEKQAIAKSKAEREKDAEELRKMNAEIAAAEVNARKSAQEQLDDILNQIRRSRLTEFEKEQEDFLIQREKMAELMKATGASELELMAFNMNTRSVLQNNANQKEIAEAQATADRKKQIKEQETLFAIDMTKKGLQAIADFTAFFAGKGEEAQKRAFEMNKKAGIAIALIDTFVSAQQVFRNTPGEIIIKSLAAAAATAAGLARVAAIRNTSYQSASSSAAPQAIRPAGIPQGGTPPPQGFNPNQSTPIVPPQGQNGNGQLPPQRVFVLERDIQNVGRRVRNVESFATFG
jgi:hypothetical protein